MNPPPDKAREWWIANRSDGGLSAHQLPSDYSGYSDAVHVIEYAAFAKLQQKLDFAHEQFELERARAEKYRVALEIYAMTNDTFPEYGDIAREALKE